MKPINMEVKTFCFSMICLAISICIRSSPPLTGAVPEPECGSTFETGFLTSDMCTVVLPPRSKVGDLHYLLGNPLRALQPRSSVGHQAVLRVRARDYYAYSGGLPTSLIHIDHCLYVVHMSCSSHFPAPPRAYLENR